MCIEIARQHRENVFEQLFQQKLQISNFFDVSMSAIPRILIIWVFEKTCFAFQNRRLNYQNYQKMVSWDNDFEVQNTFFKKYKLPKYEG